MKTKVLLPLVLVLCLISGWVIADDVTEYYSGLKLKSCNVLIEMKIETPLGNIYGLGSGVVISNDGLILTAGHVINIADIGMPVLSKRIRVRLHDGRTFDVNDFYVDDKLDIGFIKLHCETKDFIPMFNSDCVSDGCTIVTVGNPGGVVTDVLTRGTVKDCDFERLFTGEGVEYILSSITVIPGNSGGGVYYRGLLIGIIDFKLCEFVGIIPINLCAEVLEKYYNMYTEECDVSPKG